jgi:serine/threonine protein phosphatase Stp1
LSDSNEAIAAVKNGPARQALPVLLLALGGAISFGLIKLTPMVSQALQSGLPVGQPLSIVELTGLAALFGPLLVCGIVGAAWLGGGGLSAGRSVLFNALLGLIIGAAGLAASAGIVAALGVATKGSSPGTVTGMTFLAGTAGILLATAAEEVFFRGWIQSAIARIWGRWPALILAALLFAAVHSFLATTNPMSLLNLFLAGLLFGKLFEITGGLAAPIAAHFAWNWTESMGLGLSPNPGVGSFGSFADYDMQGDAMLGGSIEGLNPTYAVAVVLCVLLGLLIIFGMTRSTKAAPVAKTASPQPLATAVPVATAPAFTMQDDAGTDVGKIREINEDSYFSDASLGVWAVADGMGGHEYGERASQAIVEALKSVGNAANLDAQIETVRNSVLAANSMIYAEGQAKGQRMGSTVVSLVVQDGEYAVLWAGDSRAYLYRDGALMQISRDHTQVQSLIDRGLLAPEDAAGHPMSHVLARAIGVLAQTDLDVVRDGLKPNDVFLLCSDGLYGLVSDAEIAERLDHTSLGGTAQDLINLSLERGAPDNVTVIVVLASA